jgi:hypothetical protein
MIDDVDQIIDQTAFLWTVFTRFDPALDIYARQTIKRNSIQYELPIIIDARMKLITRRSWNRVRISLKGR